MRRVILAAACALVSVAAYSTQDDGLGRISFPTSGPAAAQRLFLRGVLLLHSFEYDDAIAQFREAQRIAPDFAMAYWGETLSFSQPLWHNENIDKARDALRRLGSDAIARAGKAPTPREKGYLDAVERLFGAGDADVRRRAYAERMATLVRDFPDDDEAALFYALALLGQISADARAPELALKAGALASAVMKRNRRHPGAAHYVLHAYDDGEHNAMALDAARLYATIAPASSHALHMPSHAFLPLGLWDEAVKSDEASFAASVARAKRTGRGASQHDFHSLSWLQYEYLQQGRFMKAREAATVLERAIDSERSAAGAAHHAESEIGRGYGPMSLANELASMRARLVIESRDWPQMKGRQRFENVDELFALGLASVALGDQPRAASAIDQLRKAAATVPDRDVREVVSIMVDEVTGVIEFAKGNRDRGLAALAAAAAEERRRPRPVARPYPIKPANELYAEFLLASGNAGAALDEFRVSLARTPRRAASLFGLAAAAAAAGSASEARSAAREFQEMWKSADLGRPELVDIKSLLDAEKK